MHRVLPALMIALVVACGGPPTPEEDRAAVGEAFDAYRDAVIEQDGEGLVSVLSAETLAFYDELREMVLHADRASLEAEPLLIQVQVLTLRMRMTRDQLEPMSGAELVVHGMREGWVQSPGLESSSIDEIRIEGDVATGRHVRPGGGPTSSVTFRREGSIWKVDPTEGMLRAGEQLEGSIDPAQRSRLLEQIVSASTGRTPSEETWKPLVPPTS